MPRLMMVGNLLRETLRVVPLPLPVPDWPAGLILQRGRPLSPACRKFAACLRAYVAEVTQRGIVAPITGGNIGGIGSDRTE